MAVALGGTSAYCRVRDSKPKKTERHMRHVLAATLAVTAAFAFSAAPSNAAPGPRLAAPTAAEGGMVEKVQIFPRRYYRQYPYGAPPVVVPAVPAVPVAPPVVVEGPVVVVPPPRPASCGEYHYWNGQYCVDARYNRPYLGPRP
jgi:hypothetical protein